MDITQIQNEIWMGLDFIETKRDIWRERLDKYVDQNKDDEKIGVNTVYATMNLWLAIRYTDETSVVIKPRKFGDEEYADNLTSLASFDFDEMNRKVKGYQMDWDEQFFWCSLEKNRGRDNIRQVIETSIEDPLTWIPDPYSDHLTDPRFHYFEVEMLKSSMNKEAWFDEEAVDNLTAWWIENINTNKTYKNEASGLNDVVEDISEDFYISVYDWIRYEWKDLYIVTVDSKMQSILRKEKIEPVTKEEKKLWVSIHTQVNVTWFSPKRNDPVWVSLLDLIVDKQKANSILMNLRLIDAKFSTFGQTNLVNTDIVKNTTELLKPSTNTKWIWVNAWNQSLANAVYPVPRQSIMQDSYTVSAELAQQIQLDTWISDNSLWIAEKGLTLWQAQQVQSNANIRLALWISITNWGEERFWKFMWLRGYEEYFDKSETKFIRVANWFDSTPVEFRRDDFLWIESPEIKIESKKKAEQDREKEKVSFLTMMPYFLEDPTTPKVIKNIALRYAMKLQWTPREMIKLLTYNKDEESAKHKLILINNQDIQWTLIDSLQEDHQTFLVIFEWAIDSEIKSKAIRERKNAYIMSGQMQMQQWAALEQGGWWQVNAMQNQMTNNMISQDNAKNTQNIWNIAQNS